MSSPPRPDRLTSFVPAETTAEAVARIYSLAGASPKARGEKRALVALRDALDLDVDVVSTNAVLGAKIAEVLDVDWHPGTDVVVSKVTLSGLNKLLAGATSAYERGSLRRLEESTAPNLQGAGWSDFRPARSKIEAVTRIAQLTGAPAEWLGPGSKEHKSVLTNLADRLLPGVRLDRSSKTRLGRDLASHLGTTWTDDCCSTGETISLIGLNTILAGAERRLNKLGTTSTDLLTSPEAEGAALTAALFDGWRAAPWDAKACIEWMRQSQVRGYNEVEWQGWYFEARGREILNDAFTPAAHPPRSRYGNTIFDYRLNRVWDLKAHTDERIFPVSDRVARGNDDAILNDAGAIRSCVEEHGLGFLMLSGKAEMDEDGSFAAWHRHFKTNQGLTPSSSNSGRSRMRKTAFTPTRVEAFFVPDTLSLNAAIAAGSIVERRQGRQAPKIAGGEGLDRADKFHLKVGKARQHLGLAQRQWTYRTQADER